MLHLLIATTNLGKVREISDLLKDTYIKFSNLSDFKELDTIDVKETGKSYEENALIKARTYGRLTGLITLADDSGLSIDALDGRPGIKSKRAGNSDPARIEAVLQELNQVPEEKRQAHFTCSMVFFDPSSEKYHTVEGQVQGTITKEPIGTHGFGYDPIFYCPELGKTFGQAYEEEKNTVSHRARALAQISEIIRKHYT